jgi:hypothetical protein
MSQPPRFTHPLHPRHLRKLNKHVWLQTSPLGLVELRFQNSKSDTSLFIYKSPIYTVSMLIYVDDILIACCNSSTITALFTDSRAS